MARIHPLSFHRAIRRSNLPAASSYLNRGVDINSLYNYPSPFLRSTPFMLRHRITALFYVAEFGNLSAVEFLIDFGADVEKRNVVSYFDSRGTSREMQDVEGFSGLEGMRMSRRKEVREWAGRRYGPESGEGRERREEVLARLKGLERQGFVGVEIRRRSRRGRLLER